MPENTNDHTVGTRKDPDRIHAAQTIVKMCLIVAASVLFNFFPEKVGVIKSLTDPSGFTPLLAPAFQSYLPWLNLYWGLAFSLLVVHLGLRRWTVVTRWLDLALRIFGAFVLLGMVLGAPFITVPILSILVKLILAVACVVMLIEAGKQFKRLLGGKHTVVQLKEK